MSEADSSGKRERHSLRLRAQLHAGELVVAANPFLSNRRERIVALGIAAMQLRRLYAWREFAALRRLISYGRAQSCLSHGRLLTREGLQGTKPSNLPVEQTTKRNWLSISDRQALLRTPSVSLVATK